MQQRAAKEDDWEPGLTTELMNGTENANDRGGRGEKWEPQEVGRLTSEARIKHIDRGLGGFGEHDSCSFIQLHHPENHCQLDLQVQRPAGSLFITRAPLSSSHIDVVFAS